MSFKVVFNNCHGGFSLSRAARDWLAERGHEEAIETRGSDEEFLTEQIELNVEMGYTPERAETLARAMRADFRVREDRHDPLLVACVEALGKEASGSHACLEIAVVKGLYRIDEYDGLETVIEPNENEWTNPGICVKHDDCRANDELAVACYEKQKRESHEHA